jgi:hypothetical protein
VDIIINKITGRVLVSSRLYFPLIRKTPINEAARGERIFAIAFLTLYFTGKADFNAYQLRKVNLIDYARYLLYFWDGRFGRYSRWKFLVFNILIRNYAKGSACFYVSKTSGL